MSRKRVKKQRPLDRKFESLTKNEQAFVVLRVLEGAIAKGSPVGPGTGSPEAERATSARMALSFAWDADDAIARRLASVALEVDPDFDEAALFRAEIVAETLEEAHTWYRVTMDIIERRHAGDVRRAEKEVAYQRALAGLGRVLWHEGETDAAFEMLDRYFVLNPRDGWRIRDWYFHFLLVERRLERLRELHDAYPEPGGAFWSYTIALGAFLEFGDNFASQLVVANAVTCNRLVADVLLGRTVLPESQPVTDTFGSTAEAERYGRLGAEAWEQAPGALELLRRIADEGVSVSGSHDSPKVKNFGIPPEWIQGMSIGGGQVVWARNGMFANAMRRVVGRRSAN